VAYTYKYTNLNVIKLKDVSGAFNNTEPGNTLGIFYGF